MHLKDSLTGALKPVRPDPATGIVSIYACGITPYSSAHVGHARTYVVFDLLARTLRAQGHNVELVRNITDIDDKIIAAAQLAGVSWQEISERYAQENRDMMVRTGLAVPREPKASQYLPEIFELTATLLEKGYAYVSTSGDVLYRVSAFKGALLMEHKEGALLSEQGQTRVAATGKEDMRDFALWKSVNRDAPGFESPWGWGRPGWHVECSAMIAALFGGVVAIHGGGVDLKFPHHQAELMQSEPVFGKPLADVWMHNGSVTSNGRKMSKSEGNFVTWAAGLNAAEVLAPGAGGQLLRLTLLQAHWQKPLDWSERILQSTHGELMALTEGLEPQPADAGKGLSEVLDDNLNVPAAMVWMRQLRKDGRFSELAASLAFLGVDVATWAAFPRARAVTLTNEQIDRILHDRQAARKVKDWQRADELRDLLIAHGVQVQDQLTK